MIIEYLKEKKDFTNNEIEIANYVLENMAKVLSLTANDLAMETYTSKAAIMRFCKKIGVEGYRDFQKKLENELNEIYRLSCLLNEEPINQKSTLEDIINIIPSMYETAVSQTRLLLDYKTLKRVLQKLKTAHFIEIYGSGVCQTIAKSAAFKLNTIGYNCTAFEGINEHYVIYNESRKNKIAILLTFSGANSYMIHTAKYLSHYGYEIIGIGGIDNADICQYCDEYINIFTKKLILSFEILSSYIAMNYIVDILFSSLLAQDYNRNVQVALDVINSKN